MKLLLIFFLVMTCLFSQTSWKRETIIDEEDEQGKRRSKTGFFLNADIVGAIPYIRKISAGYSISSNFKAGITFHFQREWSDRGHTGEPGGFNSSGIYQGSYNSTVKVANYQHKIPYMGQTLFLEVFPFKKTLLNNFYIPVYLGRISPSVLINEANFILYNLYTKNSNFVIANIVVNETASLYHETGLGFRLNLQEGLYMGIESSFYSFPNRRFKYNVKILSKPQTNPISLLDYYLYSKQAEAVLSYPKNMTTDLRLIIGKIF